MGQYPFAPDSHEVEAEQSLEERVGQIIAKYFPEDESWLEEFTDIGDKLGAIYGQLVEIGEDPDEAFVTYGITIG
jgi:hypothetical protein